ncbi:hypothetical protein [Methylobacterium aquaticum]|uniref:hypothetical protein n=1 Tax=Methylobacterium aquaticum TaxID=270351 RepID=UPI0019324B35|nr:hypothetical protein [Methylobacterium aquaticum]QRE77358.1 hypothetical protein F1D61_30960 [Methylobacterium aquaticum]
MTSERIKAVGESTPPLSIGFDIAIAMCRRADVLGHPYPSPELRVWLANQITIAVNAARSSSPTPDGVIKERGEDDADLNARLKAAGMYSIPEMMGVTPLTRWIVQAGMTDLDALATWLDRRVSQFLRMKAGYELGDKDKGDNLYEWVNAHSAAFSEVRANLRAVREAIAEAPASIVQPPSSQESGVGETEGSKVTAWLERQIETSHRDADNHPKGSGNRSFYRGQAIAYENALSLIEEGSL